MTLLRPFLIALSCAGLFAQTAEFERAQRILRDWPNLARYRDANLQLQPPAAGERRVVFIGASMIDLWGRKYGEFFPSKQYVNRGISGQTTPQMLARFRQDVISIHPSVVVIMGGGNDLAGNTGPMRVADIEGNLQSMAELARVHNIRVVLASVMPSCDAAAVKRPVEHVRELNTWMKSYAEDHGHVFLDWFTPMAAEDGSLKRDLTYDCLHANNEGYALMAPLAEKAIGDALARE